MKSFSSVSTNAARIQDISLNPQKLAGMCAKLKCCLNYEVDDYMEASRRLPHKDVVLETQDGEYYLFKSDILAGMCSYSTDKNLAANIETITAARAREVIAMNKRGEKPQSLHPDGTVKEEKKPVDLLADTDVSRFDKARKKKKTQRRDRRRDEGKGEENRRQNRSLRQSRQDRNVEGKQSGNNTQGQTIPVVRKDDEK